MREILFRGKREDNKTWVCGMPCATEQSGIYAIQTLEGGIFDVIPETVGQYTGLTDKNGKKIFEGDIIKADNWLHENMKAYTIVFEDCGFYASRHGDSWNFDHLDNIEVVGNIHDNPQR